MLKIKNYLTALLVSGAAAVTPQYLHAAEPAPVRAGFIHSVSAYIDSADSSPDQILQFYKEGRFMKSEGIMHQFGYTDSAVWIVFRVTNQKSLNRMVLVNHSLTASSAYLFSVTGNRLTPVAYGGLEAPGNFTSEKYIFRLTESDDGIFFIRLLSSYSVQFSAEVAEKDNILPSIIKNNRIILFISGIISGLFIYNLFLYISLRDNSYLFYSLFLFFGIVPFLANYPVFYELVSAADSTGKTAPVIVNSLLFAWVISASQFAVTFFRLKFTFPVLYRILNFFTIILFLQWIAHFFIFYRQILIIGEFTAFVVFAFILISAIYIFIKGNKTALLYLIAFAGFWFFIVLFILATLNLIPMQNYDIFLLPGAAAVWDSVFLSFALAYRYRIIQKENKILEEKNKELHQAKEFHNFMMPQPVYQEKEFRVLLKAYPSGVISGDFADWKRISDTESAFFISDVSGHGLSSGFISSMVKVSLHYSLENNPAESVLESVNRMVFSHTQNNFITAELLIVNSESKTATVFCAGHLPLYYFSSETGKMKTVKPAGTALGVSENAVYSCISFPYRSGDRFILLTDGLMDLPEIITHPSPADKLEKFIQECIQIESDRLTDELILKCSGRFPDEFPDDITVLIIDIK